MPRTRSATSAPSECPHSVAPFDAGGVEQRDHPVGDRLDARQRAPRRAPVPGQVDGEHVAAVPGEIARLQRPDAVVVGGAVHEDDGGQRRIEGAAARCRRMQRWPATVNCIRPFLRGVQRAAEILDEVVGVLQPDRQPDRALADAGVRAGRRPSCGSAWCWPGWMTSDLASPTLARCENTRSASMNLPALRARAAQIRR